MRHLLIAGLSVMSLTACNSAATKDPSIRTDSATQTHINKEEAKEERNKQIVKASTEGFSALNVEAVAKDFHPNIIDYSDGINPPVKGVDSFKYYCRQFFKSVEDMKGENLNYTADGDWVVVWGDWHWTWKKDSTNKNATNKSFSIRAADIFKFNEEGKVIEHYGIVQPVVKGSKSELMPN